MLFSDVGMEGGEGGGLVETPKLKNLKTLKHILTCHAYYDWKMCVVAFKYGSNCGQWQEIFVGMSHVMCARANLFSPAGPVSRNKVSPITKSTEEEIFPLPRRKYFLPLVLFSAPLTKYNRPPKWSFHLGINWYTNFKTSRQNNIYFFIT